MKHLNDISENLDKYLDSAKSSSSSNENKRLSNYEKFVSFYKMNQDTINIVLSTNVLDAEYDKITSAAELLDIDIDDQIDNFLFKHGVLQEKHITLIAFIVGLVISSFIGIKLYDMATTPGQFGGWVQILITIFFITLVQLIMFNLVGFSISRFKIRYYFLSKENKEKSKLLDKNFSLKKLIGQ